MFILLPPLKSFVKLLGQHWRWPSRVFFTLATLATLHSTRMNSSESVHMLLILSDVRMSCLVSPFPKLLHSAFSIFLHPFSPRFSISFLHPFIHSIHFPIRTLGAVWTPPARAQVDGVNFNFDLDTWNAYGFSLFSHCHVSFFQVLLKTFTFTCFPSLLQFRMRFPSSNGNSNIERIEWIERIEGIERIERIEGIEWIEGIERQSPSERTMQCRSGAHSGALQVCASKELQAHAPAAHAPAAILTYPGPNFW